MVISWKGWGRCCQKGGEWPDSGVKGTQTGDPGPSLLAEQDTPYPYLSNRLKGKHLERAWKRPLSTWVVKGKHRENWAGDVDRDRLKSVGLGQGSSSWATEPPS